MTSIFSSFSRAVRPISITSILAGFLFLPQVASTHPAQQCQGVPFEEVRQDIGPRNGVGVARILLRAEDMTIDNLVCLERTLKAVHQDWVSVTVLVFSSRAAAVSFEADKMATVGVVGAFDRELRAVYWIGADNAGDSLTLTPLGWELLQQDDYNTVVMLPAQQAPRCRISLNRRCVLTLDRIRYPLEALRHGSSGRITMTGRIDEDGNLIDVQGALSDRAETPLREVLIESAVNNLRTWRVEPAPRQESFRIVFDFNFDASLRSGYTAALPALQDRFRKEGITRVDFGAEQVSIRGALPD